MTEPVLILGATGGIGSALARRLRRDDVPIVLLARDERRVNDLAVELACPAITADVTETDRLTEAVRDAACGGLAGLAYCPGSLRLGALSTLTETGLLDNFRVNAVGAAMAISAAAPALKTAGGAIVLFSTVAVTQGFPHHTAIAAAKAAVEAICRSAAAELAPQVRVNCIAPSLTQTPLASALLSNPQLANAIAAAHPLGRIGQPEDIVELAAFLLGPRASWITGQIFHVDGGRSSLRVRGQ